jgi:hypothetical protein
MAGLSRGISGDQVQITLGTIARDLHQAMKRTQEGVDFLAANTDQDLLTDYQISGADAALLRAAYTDLDELWRIYRGADPLPAAKNFRQTVRRIFGLGF